MPRFPPGVITPLFSTAGISLQEKQTHSIVQQTVIPTGKANAIFGRNWTIHKWDGAHSKGQLLGNNKLITAWCGRTDLAAKVYGAYVLNEATGN